MMLNDTHMLQLQNLFIFLMVMMKRLKKVMGANIYFEDVVPSIEKLFLS